MVDRRILAKLWHERAKVTRQELFGLSDVDLRPVTSASQADIAVPGMVGKNYEIGGLVIVSVNPAGGKDDFRPTSGDAKLYEAAKAIAQSDNIQLFEQMNQAYRLGMPSWGAQWRHINAILSATQRSLRQLAYSYLVPFRTRGDKGSALKQDVIDRAYRAGLAEIMQELQPALVIPVDRHSECCCQSAKKQDLHVVRCCLLYAAAERSCHPSGYIAGTCRPPLHPHATGFNRLTGSSKLP